MTPREAPAVRLVPIHANSYDAWLDDTVREYADGHVEAGNWPPDEALERSRQAFAELLPDGSATVGQHLFTILADDGTDVGVVWVGPRDAPGKLFIWDLAVWPAARGRGYGGATLRALDAWAVEHGFDRIGLHVFGSNDTARRLYARAGYIETDVMMEKRLRG